MQFDVDWVDAFADVPFGGNGCAVVHDGAGLNDDTCKGLRARNLSGRVYIHRVIEGCGYPGAVFFG